MGDIVVFFLKHIVVSALLWVFYVALFKTKASYRSQRVFLLLIPFFAFLAALLSFDIFHIEREGPLGQIITTVSEVVDVIESNQDELLLLSIDDEAVKTYGELPSATHLSEVTEDSAAISEAKLDLRSIFVMIWCGVGLVILIGYIRGIRSIFRLKIFASKTFVDGYPIYRCGFVQSPFSFWQSIYIDRVTDGEKLDFVLNHEIAHVRNRHYIDKFILELYLALFWFSPFVWMLRKELGGVHEFEADKDVLSANCNKQAYKRFLFEEADSSTPVMANGFNNSLIKQRFIQMKNGYRERYVRIRKYMTFPYIALLLMMTSFTYTNDEAIHDNTEDAVVKIADQLESIKASASISYDVDSNSADHLEILDVEQLEIEVLEDSIDGYVDGFVDVELMDDQELGSLFESDSQEAEAEVLPWYLNPLFYQLDRSQYNVFYEYEDVYAPLRARLKSPIVVRYDDFTEVYMGFSVHPQQSWVFVHSNFYLRDAEDSDKYMIHSVKGGAPLDKTLIVDSPLGDFAVMTFIFPPLKKGLKQIDLEEVVDESIEGYQKNDAGKGWNYRGLTVYDKKPDILVTALDIKLYELDKKFKIEE